MEWLYLAAIILSATGTILAWLAKLKWSKEFAEAKKAALDAKEIQIQGLTLELDNLRQLSSPKMREYFLKTKEHLEEFNDVLQRELRDTRAEAERLARQLEGRAADAEQQLKELIDQLELTKAQKNQLEEALAKERVASTRRISHEVAQPVFAALTSIEFLIRRDQAAGRTARLDPIDYYFKQSLETNLRMIAFLNDRLHLRESAPSFSSALCNLLSDVLMPAFRMFIFGIYSRYQRDSGAPLDPDQLEGFAEPPADDIQFLELTSSLGGRTYAIRCDRSLESVRVYVDRYPFQQIAYAMLDNALRYRQRDSDLFVELELCANCQTGGGSKLSDDYFVVEIADSGAGVDRDEAEQIFEIGYRGRNARGLSRYPGSGQGLYVCRTILRGIGGEIVLRKHRWPTVFCILIPRECSQRNWVERLPELRERTNHIIACLQDGGTE